MNNQCWNYKKWLEQPSIKSKYNSMLKSIKDIINNPNITYRPLKYKYEYWLFTINKNNKVSCNNWVDYKKRSINRELKRLV